MARTYQGDTTLPVDEVVTAFRFELNVTSEDALIVWLEDRSSKKQWQSSALKLGDFVIKENAIPKATIAQYAKLFSACLSEEIDGSTRSLRAKGTGDGRILVLGIPFSSMPLTVNVEYELSLGLVPLERVDLLGARMRDAEEKLDDLYERSRNNQVEGAVMEKKLAAMQEQIDCLIKRMEKPRKYARATTKSDAANNEIAVWTVDSGARVWGISFGQDGRIQLSEPGLYALDFGFVHVNTNNSVLLEIHIGNRVEQVTHSSYSKYSQTTAYRCVVKVKTKEEIHVAHLGNGHLASGSYVSITEL